MLDNFQTQLIIQRLNNNIAESKERLESSKNDNDYSIAAKFSLIEKESLLSLINEFIEMNDRWGAIEIEQMKGVENYAN